MRLIDADALIKTAKIKDLTVGVEDVIGAPTIEAQPVVHAEWLSSETIYSKLKCSNCEYEFCACARSHEVFRLPNYCQNCGAKMDLEDGD